MSVPSLLWPSAGRVASCGGGGDGLMAAREGFGTSDTDDLDGSACPWRLCLGSLLFLDRAVPSSRHSRRNCSSAESGSSIVENEASDLGPCIPGPGLSLF